MPMGYADSQANLTRAMRTRRWWLGSKFEPDCESYIGCYVCADWGCALLSASLFVSLPEAVEVDMRWRSGTIS